MDDSAAGKPEFYGWYNLDSKIDSINNKIGVINGEIGVINGEIGDIKSNIQDLYSRISALETNYGDALNITNQILG